MKSTFPAALGASLLILTACTSTSGPLGNNSSSPTVSSVPMQETKNVTYQGTLQAAGASIFMEGTHKLQLEDGRFIMLESTAADLDTYIGMKVELFGAVRPTTEAGGMIMRVERVTSMEPSSSSSDASSSSDSSSSSSDESSASTIASSAVSSSQSSVASSSSSKSSSSVVSSVASSVAMETSSSGTYEGSAELSDKAAIMAKDNMSPSLWTQQYCTKTAAYCVSVHKNWYFKSFGATSTTLWHMEIGPQELNNIGEGPLSVNLVSGSTALDGQVQTEGSSVVGYKEWTENRHFEIRGPANLKTAITYMLSTLKAN